MSVTAAIVGGVSGLVGAGLNAYNSYQERKAAEKRREEANRQISSWQQAAENILEESRKNDVRMSSPEDLEAYQSMKAGYDPDKFVYTDYNPFDKSKYNVEDYLNPAKDQIMADLAKSSTATAAGAALGHSSGALEAYNRAAVEKSEQLYNDAYNKMKDERNFDYGEYTDYINQKQKELDAKRQGLVDQMNMYRGDITFDQQQQDAYTANRLNLGNAIMQSRASLV